MRTRIVAGLMGLLLLASIGGVQAAKPGANATCWMEPGTITAGQRAEIWATGLPTKAALNVFVVDGGETYGFPVGIHPDGLLEHVWYTPEHAGPLELSITGPERGQTRVYASCAYQVQPAG